MKIAILAWGSLCWDEQVLQKTGKWLSDGPALPIEFARISQDGRLTLVIKPGFDEVNTLYITSAHDTLAGATENLRKREKTTKEHIGFIDFTTIGQDGRYDSNVRKENNFMIDVLCQWNKEKKYDAIIWTDLPPKFTDAIKKEFTIDNVIAYINGLEKEKDKATEYIRKAPKQITTRFRDALKKGIYSDINVENNVT